MVITPDFGSSNVGSIPAGVTVDVLLVQWIVHESSKLRMIVRFYQGVHDFGMDINCFCNKMNRLIGL